MVVMTIEEELELLNKQQETLRKSLQENQLKIQKKEQQYLDEQGIRFYVYYCLVDGDVVYIGKGTKDRWKHCYGGSSSCSRLNRDWFNGKLFEGYRGNPLSESEAEIEEMCEIFTYTRDGTLYNKLIPNEDDEGIWYRDWGTIFGDEGSEEFETYDRQVMNKRGLKRVFYGSYEG